MSTGRYTIDPDGDVILLLMRPTSAPTGSEPNAAGQPPDVKSALTQTDDKTDGTTDEKMESAEKDGSVGTSSESPAPAMDEVQMLVSSKHLALASPVFKAMLKGNFREGVSLGAGKVVKIALPDDDAHALLLILCIIHSRWFKVPAQVVFSTLMTVTTLVDKYGLAEATAGGYNSWLGPLVKSEPDTVNFKLYQWIFIYWATKRATSFKRTTRMAMRQARGTSVENEGKELLPLPDLIVETIHEKRQMALRSIFTLLKSLLDQYEQMQVRKCRWKSLLCDSAVLGTLTMGLKSHQLLPLPEPPYEGISFEQLLEDLGQVPHPTFDGRPVRDTEKKHANCGVLGQIGNVLRRLDQDLQGLDLADFEGKRIHRDRV